MSGRVIYRTNPIKILKDSRQGQSNNIGDRLPWPIDLYSIAAYTDRNAIHCACLYVKASCILGQGYSILNIPESEADDVYNRLDRINPQQSFQEVLTRLALDFETFGNAYLEVVRNPKGVVTELYHLPALLAWLIPQDRGILYENEDNRYEYPYFASGGKDSHSVVHFANYNPLNRHYGLPDWIGAVPAMDLDYYASAFNQKFFLNAAMPDLAVLVEGGSLDETAEQAIVEFFQTSLKGLDNSHRTLFLNVNAPEVKVRFERLTAEVKDLSFDRMMQTCRDRIISAHRVPPRLVGVAQPGALGGTSEVFGQLSIFKDLVITPRQSYFSAKLTRVLRDMGYPKLQLQFASIDTTAQETDSDYYTKLVSGGVLTIDEAREELGYPALGETAQAAVKGRLSLVRSLERLREAV